MWMQQTFSEMQEHIKYSSFKNYFTICWNWLRAESNLKWKNGNFGVWVASNFLPYGGNSKDEVFTVEYDILKK